MSAKYDASAPHLHAIRGPRELRVTTRAGYDGRWPEAVSTLRSGIRWTQGEAPHRTGFIAWGETLRIETKGPDRFTAARAQLTEILRLADVDDEVNRPGSGLVAFGAFTFDDSSERQSFLVIPQYIHAFDGTTAWNTTIELSQQRHEMTPPGATVPQTVPIKQAPEQTVPIKQAPEQTVPIKQAPTMTPCRWLGAVATAIDRIKTEKLEKVVLARAVNVTMSAPIDDMALADTLSLAYPQCWTYAMDGLVGATPEMLVQVRGGAVMSRVLAGTISRRDDVTQTLGGASSWVTDSERAQALVTSQKDHGEHDLAVDSVAGALRGKGIDVEVPEHPFVLELPNVMHLATDLHGRRPEAVSALDLAEALHPSAAVCGTPTVDAFATIAELEELDRGLYSGPVGWVDGSGNGEWGIALRSGQIDHDDSRNITLYAGCGIVGDSVPEEELAETEAKFLPMREALGLPAQS